MDALSCWLLTTLVASSAMIEYHAGFAPCSSEWEPQAPPAPLCCCPCNGDIKIHIFCLTRNVHPVGKSRVRPIAASHSSHYMFSICRTAPTRSSSPSAFRWHCVPTIGEFQSVAKLIFHSSADFTVLTARMPQNAGQMSCTMYRLP